MTESMLTALMKLFAILAIIKKDVPPPLSRNFVLSYLKIQFSQKIVDHSLSVFDKEISKLERLNGLKESKRTSSLSVKILSICREINLGLHIKGKYLIVVSLIQYAKYFDEQADSPSEFRQTISDMVGTISDDLMILPEEYRNCRIFITDKFYKVPRKDRLLVVSNINTFSFTKINFLQKDHLNGQFFFLKIQQTDLILFYYSGMERIELGNTHILPGHIYIFTKGSSLKGENISPIYYSDIEAGFLRIKIKEKISFKAENIEFRFPKSDNGIHKFTFAAESGDLVGIIGGSGTGKSTLLKIISGTFKPGNGVILINGHDFQTEKKKFKGIIGYVPQDDLLIEELTVYQNLYFNAKLCLGNHSEKEIHDTVANILNNLDLFYIKDLKVGSPLNKFISGGQRKRLNIALELIKEPLILLADEPTSGLSSTDSENVMQLLKELSLQGKIVILNIHSPSSEIFRMLDMLLILDKGGYPVYLGNPLDSFSYVKEVANRIDASEIECPYCGNVQPDEILKVIEAKQVNEFGEYTNERVISPEEWYDEFISKQEKEIHTEILPAEIPVSSFRTPARIKQFTTYSRRNFLSKLADRQYSFFALLISPLLALILGYFTKYVSGSGDDSTKYLFINNVNIPAYIFMSVIVALFVGLIISAEEITKDRKILEREKFLNLSRVSYLNSKILFLFALSAFQMLIFVFAGNSILEIKSMNLSYWTVLFSTACFAVMLGLNISSALKSVIAIYITIPFILVPLILLSGIIVKYDKMHYTIASEQYVPVVGDLMASRWAYEALMVNQFRNNPYQKEFYEIDCESANLTYDLNFLIPELNNVLEDYSRLKSAEPNSARTLMTEKLIVNSVESLLNGSCSGLPFPGTIKTTDSLGLKNTRTFLNACREKLIKKTNSLIYERDDVYKKFASEGFTNDEIIRLKETCFNRSVAEMVLNTNEMTKITALKGRFIRKDSPVYQVPSSRYGRAQFYAGSKRLGSLEISTVWFNTMVLWLMTIILYLALAGDLLKRTLEYGLFSRFLKRIR
jgi:ABC transport system ATP-binding/permease protein